MDISYFFGDCSFFLLISEEKGRGEVIGLFFFCFFFLQALFCLPTRLYLLYLL